VDFSIEKVIVAGSGEQPSPRYSIHIDSVRVASDPATAYVRQLVPAPQ
jgi:hypothetical protein